MNGEVEQKRKDLWDLLSKPLAVNVDSIKASLARHLEFTVARNRYNVSGPYVYRALAHVVREVLIDRWNTHQARVRDSRAKRVYYLSLEFLPGQSLFMNLINLNIMEPVRTALADFGYAVEDLASYEPDAGLGNGGLGRLAACFMESTSTLGIPCYGNSLRYEFGIFHQQILKGYQKETPDNWLIYGNPWEVIHPSRSYPVEFFGYTEQYIDERGRVRSRWIPSESMLAMAHDHLVPGYHREVINPLRLWSGAPGEEFNLDYFNHGDYIRAVQDKIQSRSISRVLYPNDSNLQGRELRLKQEYMLVTATLQDALRDFLSEEADVHGNGKTGAKFDVWDRLPERVFFQLNDTHPALAVPELVRLLVDTHGVDMDRAREITRACTGYTNHTVMPEALECWDLEMFGRLLPRHLEIVFDLNQRLLDDLRRRGEGEDAIRRVSMIEEGPRKRVRMANLAAASTSRVNGVSQLHSRIIQQEIFPDLHRAFPDRITGITNGITHRRWMVAANPELTELITESIGDGWICDLDQLRQLERADLIGDAGFRETWRAIKRRCKERLARLIHFECGVLVDPDAMFDVQVKRFHEYKRQHLNILRVIREYHRLKADPQLDVPPRVILFAGKAAPAYYRAKMIIKLIHSVGRVVNSDPEIGDRLKVVFLPDYRVSLAEQIFPASDLSEQISTAGMEASGTGNMKFMLNGALTIGTCDGATIEMAEQLSGATDCSEGDIYLFGLRASQIADLRRPGRYDPVGLYQSNPGIASVLNAVKGNLFNRDEPGIFQELYHSLTYGGDPYFVLADFDAYTQTQDRVGRDFRDVDAWTRASIRNTARSGYFSADRAIREYARQIWRVPV